MKVIFTSTFWTLALSVALAQTPVQHEISLDIGLGTSGVLYPTRAQSSPSPEWEATCDLTKKGSYRSCTTFQLMWAFVASFRQVERSVFYDN